jgi:hypothetical protein
MCFRAYSVKSGMSLSVSIAPLRTHPRFLIESFVFNPICCLFGSEWDFLFSGVSSVRHDSDAACGLFMININRYVSENITRKSSFCIKRRYFHNLFDFKERHFVFFDFIMMANLIFLGYI